MIHFSELDIKPRMVFHVSQKLTKTHRASQQVYQYITTALWCIFSPWQIYRSPYPLLWHTALAYQEDGIVTILDWTGVMSLLLGKKKLQSYMLNYTHFLPFFLAHFPRNISHERNSTSFDWGKKFQFVSALQLQEIFFTRCGSKVKVGVLRPVQQPGSYGDRSSELPLVGLEPTEVTAYD